MAPLTLDQTYKIIVKEGIRLTGAVRVSVLLRRENGFETVYSSLPSNQRVVSRKRGFAYQAYKTRKTLIVQRNKIIPHHPEFKKTDLKHLAFVPLSYGKYSSGILTFLFNRPDTFTEEQIKVLNLFGSIASLAIRKMQSQEEMKNALETRDLFISLASHELKTPLTSIKIYAELIKKKLPRAEESEKKLLGNLLSSIERLTKLIDEFLQVDQIKKGKLKYYWSEQKLSAIVEQAVYDFKVMHPYHRLSYQNNLKKSEFLILADSNKLLQAINNLLNNASKFSKEESEIQVTLTSKDSNLIVKIKDQGVGIDPKEIPYIFRRFYKGKSKRPGMGLGLYLTKQIILKHHGDINVYSKINGGTTFEISLPPKKYGW